MTKRVSHPRRMLLILLTLTLVASACSSSDSGEEDATPEPTQASGEGSDLVVTGEGPLTVDLSEGEAAADAGDSAAPVVTGEPLSDDDVVTIFDRLDPWTTPEEDVTDFNRPAETLAPPRVGASIDTPFPAEGTNPPPPVDDGPLEVLRFQPEGDVSVAPFLSVTFNQPMVPLTTLEQLDVTDVPVTMTPELPGRWQWIGTRTLRFEHDQTEFDRLPMATDYTVEIPAGTTSATGGELAKTLTWTFATPPATVQSFAPYGEDGPPLPLEPIFVATFDQKVDAGAVLETIELTADGDRRALRLATAEEIEADDTARGGVAALLEDRWIAFRPVDPLPRDAAIEVDIGPDVPSTEGPLTSPDRQTYSARTYAPLAVDYTSCDRGCEPDQPLGVAFNNPIDLDAFDQAWVTVAPEVTGAFVSVEGATIRVSGGIAGDTTYDVTFDGRLTDVFGQTLGDDLTVSLDVGDARPRLDPLRREIITLDPLADKATVPITSIGHDELHLRVFDVQPGDWNAFSAYYLSLQGWYGEDQPPSLPPFAEVVDTIVDVAADRNELAETLIDVSGQLAGEPGHLVVLIEPTGDLADLTPDDDHYWNNRPVFAWVQSTSLGTDVLFDSDELRIWTTDLATGAPREGVSLTVPGTDISVTSDAQGLATTVLPGPGNENQGPVLVATAGNDSALLPDAHWSENPQSDTGLWYVFDDRSLYRPGETARLKGWVRQLTLSTDAQLTQYAAGTEVTYTAYDAQENEIATGSTALNALGGFNVEIEIPEGANLGYGRVAFALTDLPAAGYQRTLRIEEFRRPEFEVTARTESPGPYIVGDPATVAVDATYFSGGPLPAAAVEWSVTTRKATYSPPNWADYTFGVWIPWWYVEEQFPDAGYGDYSFVGDPNFPGPDAVAVETFTGRTGRDGSHFLEMNFGGDGEGLPTTVAAQATVFDVNRQGWSSTADVLVHPAEVYVGLRSPATFVRPGEPLDIEGIVTDIDGNATADHDVQVEASRQEWRYENGEYQEIPVDPQVCEITSGAEPFTCSFTTDVGGKYLVTATVTDASGRESRTELTRWVSGGAARPLRTVEQQEALLIPDAEDYQSGDTAEVLVESPFGPASGLLTLSRNGFVSTETFTIEESSTILEIAIEDAHVPNIHVQVDLTGVAQRSADDGSDLPDVAPRPAFATGQLDLAVPPSSRTLSVTAEPVTETVEPGTTTQVGISVVDDAGEPVAGAEMAVVVVDEAVLALTGFELSDPNEVFYQPIQSGVWSEYARRLIVLSDPAQLRPVDEQAPSSTLQNGVGGDAAADGAPFAEGDAESLARSASDTSTTATGPPIDVRTNFDALALFAPEVTTDESGRALVDVPLPDSLTRYRVMVVAVDGTDHFGMGEANITARLPLMVRPSAPRFLNFGDAFELPVVIQNQTDLDMVVDVGLQTSNLTLTGDHGQRVTVPANDRVEVRFPADAAAAGTARFRVAAVSGAMADAATVDLPVYTPVTSEAFAVYGVVDDGAIAQPVETPEGVIPQFGGLEVDTSSTAVQALTDAVLYLTEYRYDSADGYASRILAIASLRDVLEAFSAEGLPPADDLNATVERDTTALAGMQNDDGGFPYWQRGRESIPYESIYAVHALVAARDEGYPVPAGAIQQGLSYLADIENRIPADYSQETKDTLSAYALHVRQLAGDSDRGKAADLYDRAGDTLGLDAIAWLWPVLGDTYDAEVLRRFENQATETAGAATFTTDYGEDAYLLLYSDRRTDGIILDALISQAPLSDLIPKVVAGLLGSQTRGRWNNAQENSFILLAMHEYFGVFEAQTPDFIARVWLGDLYAAEHRFEGRTTEHRETLIPMTELLGRGDGDLVVAKEGPGRLYYRLGLRYAPDDFDLDPLDRGFVVQRTYEGVDDPADVRRDDEGVWHVKAGAEVRVTLSMVADSRRTHVALVDPLPAGLEAQNPELATTAQQPPVIDDGGAGVQPLEAGGDVEADLFRSIWWAPWYEHTNLRDDRAEAFSSYIGAGTYDYTYIARATTPGTFVVPPTRAEEIFSPDVFGRSSSDTLVVEPG